MICTRSACIGHRAIPKRRAYSRTQCPRSTCKVYQPCRELQHMPPAFLKTAARRISPACASCPGYPWLLALRRLLVPESHGHEKQLSGVKLWVLLAMIRGSRRFSGSACTYSRCMFDGRKGCAACAVVWCQAAYEQQLPRQLHQPSWRNALQSCMMFVLL